MSNSFSRRTFVLCWPTE